MDPWKTKNVLIDLGGDGSVTSALFRIQLGQQAVAKHSIVSSAIGLWWDERNQSPCRQRHNTSRLCGRKFGRVQNLKHKPISLSSIIRSKSASGSLPRPPNVSCSCHQPTEKSWASLHDRAHQGMDCAKIRDELFPLGFRNAERKTNVARIPVCLRHTNNRYTSMNGIRTKKLPKKAIIYDYTVQPIAETVINRKFWPSQLVLSAPFLRPIVIDGVGLFKAYRNCCHPNDSECPFPMVQIVRCLFYWVCKGHSTILFFPINCNPLHNEGFHATETEKTILKELIKFKMAVFFRSDAEQNKEWYAKTVENHQACLITTVSQWHMDMPNDLESFILSSGNDYTGLDLRAYAKVLYTYLPHDSRLRETTVMLKVLKRLEDFF
ncbi:hypothetical protein Ddc_07734 [Ditylenchus destructor]|nr:hypothetical protein Ddc_07734 [Ditylenchus destructor]